MMKLLILIANMRLQAAFYCHLCCWFDLKESTDEIDHGLNILPPPHPAPQEFKELGSWIQEADVIIT